jgi:chemotaxis protein CheY-P-specific phosphatase CheC
MWQKILFETSKKVFEDAAFALVDSPDEAASEPSPLSVVCVDFCGPFSGRMALQAPETLSRAVAANMLGIEEDDPEVAGKTEDALGELLNMICGNFLPAVAGAEPEFKIGAPARITEDDFKRISMARAAVILHIAELCVEGHAVKVALFMTDETS